jgi:hypothetical protein
MPPFPITNHHKCCCQATQLGADTVRAHKEWVCWDAEPHALLGQGHGCERPAKQTYYT